MATTVKLSNNPVNLNGDLPELYKKGQDFTFVKTDLTDQKLFDLNAKAYVIVALPSLDTPVCAKEANNFNEKMAEISDAQCLIISKDLPFAMARHADANNVSNIMYGSDFRYGEFAKKYNVGMTDGGMKGLLARVVFILDQDFTIKYIQTVPEIGEEPDYFEVIENLKKIV